MRDNYFNENLKEVFSILEEENKSPSEDFISSISEENEEIEDFSNLILKEKINENVIEKENTQIETPIENKNSSVDVSWTSSLSDVTDSFTLKDFDAEFVYRRIIDPSNEKSNYFNVFCKVKDKKTNKFKWVTHNGSLSKQYVVASMERYARNIVPKLKIIEEPKFYHDKFKSIWSVKTDSEIDLFDDEESKIVFGIISGIAIDKIDEIKSNISVLLSNSYDGSKALRMDYNISTTALIDNNLYSLRDFFSLSRFGYYITHKSKLLNINAEISDIKDQMKGDIEKLKLIDKNIDKIAEGVAKIFYKKSKMKFESYWENLVDSYKNLYYLLLIASIVLNEDYSILEYYKLKSVAELTTQH
jgi:hypothetical protein